MAPKISEAPPLRTTLLRYASQVLASRVAVGAGGFFLALLLAAIATRIGLTPALLWGWLDATDPPIVDVLSPEAPAPEEPAAL